MQKSLSPPTEDKGYLTMMVEEVCPHGVLTGKKVPIRISTKPLAVGRDGFTKDLVARHGTVAALSRLIGLSSRDVRLSIVRNGIIPMERLHKGRIQFLYPEAAVRRACVPMLASLRMQAAEREVDALLAEGATHS